MKPSTESDQAHCDDDLPQEAAGQLSDMRMMGTSAVCCVETFRPIQASELLLLEVGRPDYRARPHGACSITPNPGHHGHQMSDLPLDTCLNYGFRRRRLGRPITRSRHAVQRRWLRVIAICLQNLAYGQSDEGVRPSKPISAKASTALNDVTGTNRADNRGNANRDANKQSA